MVKKFFKKHIFFFLIFISFYQSWNSKSFITLLFSIILLNVFFVIKSKSNLFRNIFLVTCSSLITLFVVETFLYLNEGKTSHFIKMSKEELNKAKEKRNVDQKILNSNKNESEDNSEKSSNNEPFFNYVGQKYLKKSKYGFLANSGNYFSKKSSSDGNLIYDVTYLINQNGFRKTPQFYEKNENTIYINFYGGSFTFGEGVAQNETLPAFFSKLSKKNVIVNNYGFHGWGVNSSLMLLKDNLKKNKYDQVNILLTFPEHALRSACKPKYSINSPKYKIQLNNSEGSHVKLVGKCRQTFLPDLINKILKKSRTLNIIDARMYKTGLIEKKDLDLNYALIKEFINVSTNNNSITLIGIIPEPGSTDEFVNTLKEFKKNDLVKILDLRLYGEKNNKLDKKYYLHKEDMHPTALAHYERAKLLIKALGF